MPADTLNTNEVKDAAGAEVEFGTWDKGQPRSHIWAQINESPSLTYRLALSHQESGVGIQLRRRSRIRFDKTMLSQVNLIQPVTNSVYIVADFAVGHLTNMNDPKQLLANMGSFCWSLGASTTILYDGTGNGAAALLNGLT